MRSATGRALWLLLGGVLALLVLLYFSPSGAELEHWLSSGKREHATVQGVLARDALHRQEAARARKHLSDSLTTVLRIVKTQQEAGAALLAQAQTVGQFRQAGAVLARANEACVDGLTLCRMRGDSLARADSAHTDSLRVALHGSDSTLAQGLQAARCRFLLLLPCVSRMQAAELGLAVGILGTVVLTHR